MIEDTKDSMWATLSVSPSVMMSVKVLVPMRDK